MAGEQELDIRTMEARGELWRCPKCGTRWVGAAVPVWKADGQCGKCSLASENTPAKTQISDGTL